MAVEHPTYIAIDLKSFYASVECVERGLNPLTTNLVVADERRTQKTICLAVSPPLKAYGIPGRPRLFEVVQKVREANCRRLQYAPGRSFVGSSYDDRTLQASPELEISYITAPPRMAYYMEYSAKIYQIYLKYIAPEDIHVYSIDEVLMDAAPYLKAYGMTGYELAQTIITDVLQETGITATAGIGTNLYLSKVAMDIMAKHTKPDAAGVRIASLDEISYRRFLWNHRPLTDFWRIGPGYAKKLEANGMFTMGDVARCSLGKSGDYYNEDLLYRLFGINAELLIDHAWGYEPCTISDIKAYQPNASSAGSGQVLPCPYDFQKARLIVREMADDLALNLVSKSLVTSQIVLTIGYDLENLKHGYQGMVTTDRYGRKIPKHAHGTKNLDFQTASSQFIVDASLKLYDSIVDKSLLIRRIHITATHLADETECSKAVSYEQLDLFTDYAALEKKRKQEQAALDREKRIQQAILSIKEKYGKNAILKGTDLEEGATAIERNQKIGGHQS